MQQVAERWGETAWKGRFFTIWLGQAASLLGSSLVHFALIWWLTSTTGSATVLALSTLAALLPHILLSPFAGAVVDRSNRRFVMMVADGLIAVLTLGLVWVFAAGLAQVWHVYAVLFARSALGAFHWPAMAASTSLMVPEKSLSRVAGLNQALQGAVGIVAPPLGALMLAVLPMHQVLAIDVVTALMAVLPLLFIRVPQPVRSVQSRGQSHGRGQISLIQDVRAGLRYVFTWPGLCIVCVMAAVINCVVNPAFSLLPILVTQHFGGQAMELGWINAAYGVGVIAGGLALSAWGGFKRRIVTSMFGLACMGAGMIVIGAMPVTLFFIAVAGMTVAGAMHPITNGPLFAVLQSTVAPDMQGRVMSLLNALATATSPLSLLAAGPLSDAFGVQGWYVVGGILCIALAATGYLTPAVANLEQGRPPLPLFSSEVRPNL
ncbi:MAG: MFS transporter [Anaerolineae bacterium]|nr:MFS transporter [Thermoflexales bacterium]MDW8407396.1 MFS transporter [Anaerolineae bacterium]